MAGKSDIDQKIGRNRARDLRSARSRHACVEVIVQCARCLRRAPWFGGQQRKCVRLFAAKPRDKRFAALHNRRLDAFAKPC